MGLNARTQYLIAMGSSVAAMLPLALCRLMGWDVPIWLFIPCLIIMMNGGCLAYAIRVCNS